MKKFMVLLLVSIVFAISTANAAILVIDNFEGYADDAALQAAWVMNAGSNIQSETLENVLNGQSMLIGNTSDSPYYAQTKYNLPGAVHNSYGVNLTSGGYDAINMTFAIPPNDGQAPWGYLGGSGGDVFLSMYDCWGQKVFSASYAGDVTPSGTGWPNGIVWEMDFATFTVGGMNLDNVEQITIGVNSTYYGDGGIFIDDITLVPEPATLVIFGLGSLLLRRKK